jgi:hypothetical protein
MLFDGRCHSPLNNRLGKLYTPGSRPEGLPCCDPLAALEMGTDRNT